MTDGDFNNFTQYGFISSDPNDPNYQYNQDIFAKTWQGTGTDGIQYTDVSNNLGVSEQTPNAMAVDIDPGFIWIQGFVGWLEAASTLEIAAADGSNPRIDRIVARLSRTTDKKVTFGVLQGTPAAIPTAPALTQTSTDIYEIKLYEVLVGAGVTTITDSDLTDERIYSDPSLNFYNQITFDEPVVAASAPTDGSHLTNKTYVDSVLPTIQTVVKSYTDLSAQSSLKIYDLPTGRAVLSAAFEITDPFDLSISPAISVGSQILTKNPETDQSGNGEFLTVGNTYLNHTGSNVDINLQNYTTVWTTDAGNLNTARRALAGCGTQSSALSFGGTTGSDSAVTEKFDGSTWATAGWNLNTARSYLAGCGTQSSALSFGGESGLNSAVTEKFDGSTWATDAGYNLNTARQSLAGCGTQSSALSFGGTTGSDSAVTEKFDGSTWATAGWNLNTARYNLAGCGSQSAALSFGGDTGSYSAVTEKFDGSTWATDAGYNLNTARRALAGCGTQSSALSFGGFTGSDSAVTEKFRISFLGSFPGLTSGELTIYLQVV